MIAQFAMLAFTMTAPVPVLNAEALKKEQEAGWADLLKDEQTATRALFKFSNRPAESVAFFKTKLKPLIIDEKTAKKLIADLASEDEKVWKPAFEALEYFDPRLAMPLQKVFEEAKPGAGQLRIASILVNTQIELYLNESDNKTVQLTCTNDSYGMQIGNTTFYVDSIIAHLMGENWSRKKQWTRVLRTINLLEHVGTLESISILKTLSKGHAEAAPTVEAKAALKRLKAE